MRMKADHCLIRKDNTYAVENVSDEAVIGVLTGLQRKRKQHDVTERGHCLYIRFWNGIYPLRALYVRFRRLNVRIARKLGILPLTKKTLGKGGAG